MPKEIKRMELHSEIADKFGNNDDIQECFTYLYPLKMGVYKTKKESSEAMGLSIRQIDYRIKKWEQLGIYDKMNEFMNSFIMREVEATVDFVRSKTPDLLMEMYEIALNSENDNSRMKAIDWIWNTIYQPINNIVEKPGAAEQNFIMSRSATMDDPTDV